MTIFGGYGAGFKTGMLVPCAGNDAIDGFLLCDGSAISRTLYPELFAAIGTTYGAGDGSTTFNLPNFINRTFWGGSSSGAYLSGTLPNITGGITDLKVSTDTVYSGGIYAASTRNVGYGGNYSARLDHTIWDASRSSSTYQDGALVRPESVQTRIYIKY